MPEQIVKLGFYIGYSDSCQGDSGGPFYQFKGKSRYNALFKSSLVRLIRFLPDGRVIQVGLVSRGGDRKGGCAKSNAPGIYTDIFPFMKWIHETSKTGSC